MWNKEQKEKIIDLLTYVDCTVDDWQVPILEAIVSPYYRGYITRQYEILSENLTAKQVIFSLYLFIKDLKVTDESYAGF